MLRLFYFQAELHEWPCYSEQQPLHVETSLLLSCHVVIHYHGAPSSGFTSSNGSTSTNFTM